LENSKLGLLQKRFLTAFFSRERRFFLTGGAALSGYHLGHRDTHDLDLFTLEDVLDEALPKSPQLRVNSEPSSRQSRLRPTSGVC
jgi:hypothetical protein